MTGMCEAILSGGCGPRLRPITKTSAPQAVPVVSKPTRVYGLEALAAASLKRSGARVFGAITKSRVYNRMLGDRRRVGLV